MTDKKKKCSPFVRGLLIYALALAAAGLITLALLYGALDAYEASRPESAIKAYLWNIGENGPTEACLAALPELDETLKSREETISALQSLLADAAYKKAPDLSTQVRCAYRLSLDGQPLGVIYLEQSEKSSFGFSPWQVCLEEYALSPLLKKVDISLPEGYVPTFNGQKLDERCIVDRAVEYETLSQYYDDMDGLPRLCRWESGAYIGAGEVRVLDRSGSQLPEESLTEAFYLDNCGKSEKSRAEEFSRELIARYLAFGANVDKNYNVNYSRLMELVIPASQLHMRMRASEGLGYSNTRSCKLLSLTLNFCTDLGDGRYLADISYVAEIQGAAEPVETESQVRLVMEEQNGVLLASAMSNYREDI